MKYNAAKLYVDTVLAELGPYCQRIEPAGSFRRRKPEVGDLDVVAIPQFTTNLFGEISGQSKLNSYDYSRLGRVMKGGTRYKRIELEDGFCLDLFIVTPPAQWGVVFLIRTGPAGYSRRFVTRRKYGGMLPSNLKVRDGAIWHGIELVPTPEEKDVYSILGLPFVAPWERS